MDYANAWATLNWDHPFSRRLIIGGIACSLVLPAQLSAEKSTACLAQSEAGEWLASARLQHNKNSGVLDMVGYCALDSVEVHYGPTPGPQLFPTKVMFIMPTAWPIDPAVLYEINVDAEGVLLNLTSKIANHILTINERDGAGWIESALKNNVLDFRVTLTDRARKTAQSARFVMAPKYPVVKEKMFEQMRKMKSAADRIGSSFRCE